LTSYPSDDVNNDAVAVGTDGQEYTAALAGSAA
jgi:hypothetical protein